MKKNLFIIGLFFFAPLILSAQMPDYKVVFDITSKDSMDHKMVIRWLNGISGSIKDAKMEVVFYGQSLDMVVKDKSTVAADVIRLAQNKNISFKVCTVAIKAHHIEKDQLLPGVETVLDGIYEIITKQKEGWGYIKASH